MEKAGSSGGVKQDYIMIKLLDSSRGAHSDTGKNGPHFPRKMNLE